MEIDIQLTRSPIPEKARPPESPHGAWLEFRGVVRGEENGQKISALEYEAYPEMAEKEIRRIMELLADRHDCLSVRVIHRTGIIPVGDTAIYVGVAAAHRAEAFALLTEFMNLLKQDVPIWKARALPDVAAKAASALPAGLPSAKTTPLSFEAALAEIQSRLQPLPPVRKPLAEAYGHVLRENVSATEDFPACDRSTRDGYAILQNDSSESFQVVDALHAADWKPRQLKSGEAVRIATGAALPGEHLRVVMQEDVERTGDRIKIIHADNAMNIRKRGEEMRKGQTALSAGAMLNAGTLALLATVGCAQPLVSPRLRVAHFTTGDEIIPPARTPKFGEIRDSNSILIRCLLQKFPCELFQNHLRENFETAKSQVAGHQSQIENADVLLISGGASVGEKDFTRELLSHLGFEIVFSRLNLHPGAPLIFGANGRRIAFGLPGNPISHFVCFNLFVAAALGRLTGAGQQIFLSTALASGLDEEPNSRETFVPGRLDNEGLRPLKWRSSGDVTCLVETNALIRIAAHRGSVRAGETVEYLPL